MNDIGTPRFLFGILTIASVVCTPPTFAQESGLSENVRREAPKQWAEYQKAFAGKLRHQETTKSVDRAAENNVRFGTWSTIKYGAHGVMSVHQNLAPEPPEEYGYAWVVNSKYAFELKRQRSQDKWVLTAIDLNLNGGIRTPHMKDDSFFTDKSWRLVGPFKAGVWIPDLFAKQGFIITKTELIRSGAHELVRTEFTFKPADPLRERGAYPTKGWINLHAGECWRVTEAEIYMEYPDNIGKAKMQVSVECEMDGKYPVLKKMISERKSRILDKEEHIVVITEYTVDRNDADEADFKLTAFGLTEPIGMAPPPRPRTWLWFSLAGLTTVAVAVFIAARRRKRNADAAARPGAPVEAS